MKVSSTIPNHFFFNPTLPEMNHSRRTASRLPGARKRRTVPIETEDTLARKQEIVCGVILALCLLSTFVLCICQLAAL